MTPFELLVLQELAALRRQVAAISLDRDEALLLLEISRTAGGLTFGARSIVEFSESAPVLRALLLSVIGPRETARRLGKCLQRLQGRTIAGLTVERLEGDSRDGALWILRESPSIPALPIVGAEILADTAL